ncbi:MAG: hypothetical protein MUF23_09020 [Pirellula sp.]|jgi:hypothetical protein|nr:hypothetical protein [Pirellula sp.]
MANAPQPPRGRSQWEQILSNRTTIFCLLFGATGFLGLPLLWMSPVFSRTEKILWSVINTLYTLALIGLAAWVCYWCYQQFQNAGIL